MSILSFIKSPEEKFWLWFQENENKLYNFEVNRDIIFNELSSQLEKVNKNLTFEFGPVMENGNREFVISAGGIKKAFHAVERLYSNRPNLGKWIIIKFRPRRNPINDISFGGKKIKADDINYILFTDENPHKIGIMLFFKDFKENEKDIWGQIGYLFLDEVLGEYDVETKVGAIVFDSAGSKYFDNSYPLKELADDFDKQIRIRCG